MSQVQHRRVSKILFCGHCGRPAVKWTPPRGHNPSWKPEWRNSCAHVGAPVRMSARRAELLVANYDAMHDARLARARAAIARGEP